MKFLHTADWHIGKKLHGFDLLAEQREAFKQILAIAKEEQVDAVVIAGDLYDRSVPAVEAVEIFNEMMIQMNLKEHFPVLAISGNHDSSTRLETGGPWFNQTQFHLNTRLEQAFQPIEIDNTQFYLLPYFEPIAARLYFEDETIRTIQAAMEKVVAKMQESFLPNKKQVLVSHFFVAGSEKTDSETKLTVGGLDVVPTALLEPFDYVALGHLHGKNALQAPNARYSGSPVKFSLSEMTQEKGVWLVETIARHSTIDGLVSAVNGSRFLSRSESGKLFTCPINRPSDHSQHDESIAKNLPQNYWAGTFEWSRNKQRKSEKSGTNRTTFTRRTSA